MATGGEAGRGGGLWYLRFREFRADKTVSKPVFVRGFYVIMHLPKLLNYPYQLHEPSPHANLRYDVSPDTRHTPVIIYLVE